MREPVGVGEDLLTVGDTKAVAVAVAPESERDVQDWVPVTVALALRGTVCEAVQETEGVGVGLLETVGLWNEEGVLVLEAVPLREPVRLQLRAPVGVPVCEALEIDNVGVRSRDRVVDPEAVATGLPNTDCDVLRVAERVALTLHVAVLLHEAVREAVGVVASEAVGDPLVL